WAGDVWVAFGAADGNRRGRGRRSGAGGGRRVGRRRTAGDRRQATGGRRRGRRAQAATRGDGGRERESTGRDLRVRCPPRHRTRGAPRRRLRSSAQGPRPTAHGLSRLCGPSACRGKGEGRTYASVSSTWISTSTGASSGSTATPTALRAWTPLSPRTSASSSLAPLMTPGWPVKSGAEATKPTTFTTRATRSRSPATDLTAARAFSAHVRARSFASSGVTSPPTLPVIGSLPSTMGSWPDVKTYRPDTTAGL